MNKRILSSLLVFAMLISAMPIQTLAYFRYKDDEILKHAESSLEIPLKDSDGNVSTLDYDATWEEIYPYGAFVFGNFEAAINEGASDGSQIVTIPVYRLGGTKGRAEVTVRFDPAATKTAADADSYSYALSGRDDITIEYENPQPIAKFQPLGKARVYAGCGILETPVTDDEGEEVATVFSLDGVRADSFKWQFTEIEIKYDMLGNDEIKVLTDWIDLADALTSEITVDNTDIVYDINESEGVYKMRDFRCVYTVDGRTYCSDSWYFGERYVEEEEEVLPEMPEKTPDAEDPTYSTVEIEEEFGSAGFTLVFAEDEWVKNIVITAKDDELGELPELGLFTLYENNGGAIYHAASTFTLLVNDDDPLGESAVGFEVASVEADQDAGSVSVKIVRTGDVSYPVSVEYSTSDLDAAAGKQYSPVSGTLMFAGDINEATITIPLIMESAREEILSFELTLSDLKGGKGSAAISSGSIRIDLTSSGKSKGITEGTNLATIIAGSAGEDISGSVRTNDPLIPEAGTHDGIQTPADESPSPARYNDDEIVTRSHTYEKGLIFSRSDYSDSTKYWRDYERIVGTVGGEYAAPMSLFTVFKAPSFTENSGGYSGTKANFSATQSSILLQHNHNTGFTALEIENASLLFSDISWKFSWPTIGIAKANRKEKDYLYVMPFAMVSYPSAANPNGGVKDWNGNAADYFSADTRDTSWSGSDSLAMIYGRGLGFSFGLSLNKNGGQYPTWQESSKGLSDNDTKSGTNGSSKVTLDNLTLKRRYFGNSTLGFTIHTANDKDIGNPGDYAVFDENSTVYQSIRPEVTIIPNAGGVTTSGQLYVGSKLKVDFKNLADYTIPQDGDITDYIYLTDNLNGAVCKAQVERESDSTYYVTLLWSGMNEASLASDRSYTLNVVMERRQEIIIDVRPSVVGNAENAIRTAWEKFVSLNDDGSSTLKYATVGTSTTKSRSSDSKHFSTRNESKDYYAANLIGDSETSSTLRLSSVSTTYQSHNNLQYINLGQDADDVILFNGRSYKGNENIYLTQADLAQSKLVFYFYDSTCLSNQTDMSITISDTYLYFDVNGNGVIDGYFDESTGYFILQPDENGVYDLNLGIISGSFDEKTFQPIVDKDGGVHQYFFKVIYKTSPRSLKAPVGASDTDTLRILPFFASTVTDGGRYSTLTKEQLSYRYVAAGYMRTDKDGTTYYDSSDGHPMYGEAATKTSMIDIPLGGDVSPVYKEYDETSQKWLWHWTPNFWGQLLFPYENPAPISHDMNMTGEAVAIAGEEPTWEIVDGKRIQKLSADGAARINGYLGSLTGNNTFGLAVTEEPYVTENGTRVKKKLSSLDDIAHDSLVLGEVSAIPNADYLSLSNGSGDTGESEGDAAGAGSMPEFEADLGISLPSTEFGLSDYAKIIMDGNSVGFSIGIPLLKMEKEFPGDNSNAQQGQTTPGDQTQTNPGQGGSGSTNPPASGSTTPGQTTTAPATPATGNPNQNSGGASGATPSTPGTTQNPTPPSSTTGSWTPARPNVPTTTAPNAGTPASSGGQSGQSGNTGSRAGGSTGGNTGGSTSSPSSTSTEPATTSLSKSFKDANESMEILRKFVSTRGQSLSEELTKQRNDAKGMGGVKSKKAEASFSVALVIMFEYNPLDNGYYFKTATVAAAVSFEFTLQYRFTFFPLLYIYLKTGFEIKISTGLGVDRVGVEGNDANAVSASAFSGVGLDVMEIGETKLKKGQAYILDTTLSTNSENKVTGLHLYMDGSFYMEVLEGEGDDTEASLAKKVDAYVKDPKAYKEANGDDYFSSGRLKSNGEDPVEVYFRKHDGRVIVILTALEEEARITSAKEVTGAKSVVYWQGIKIEPSGFIEVGAGIGIDLLKFELYLKATLGLGFSFGAYNTDIQAYEPASFDSFALSAAIGFRVTVLFFNYSMDLLGYYLTYNKGEGWESKFAALNGAVPLNGSRNAASDSSYVHVTGPENNWYDVIVDGETPMTRAYDPTDSNARFQISGYGTSGDGFRLIDGLSSGYTYKVFTAGGDSYLLYTRPKAGATGVDIPELVLSKVVVTGDSQTRLVNPLDDNETALVVDGDGTGDLDFTAAVNGSTVTVTWVSYKTAAGESTSDVGTASKNTVIKTATLDLSEGTTATGFENKTEISTAENLFTFLPSQTENASVWAETVSTANVETQKANLNKYLTSANYLVDAADERVTDITNADDTNPANATAIYRWNYQTALDELYGDGSKLVLRYDGANHDYALSAGERVENIEARETDDAVIIAFTTSMSTYVDENGSTTAEIDETTDLANVKRLYLMKFDKTTKAFETPKLLRTVIDFDKCTSANINPKAESGITPANLKDGVYSLGALETESVDPYISNLRFTDAKFTNSASETLFTFEMNGNTYVITEEDTADILAGIPATITPIFAPGVADTGTDVVIGSDNEGNLAIVYSAPVSGTTNNALFIAWWDVNANSWGSPNILAMNHLQVKEDAEKYHLTDKQIEKAYLGETTGNEEYDAHIASLPENSTEKGDFDQFTFSNLNMTLIKVRVEEDGKETTKDQLIVFSEGIYQRLTSGSFDIDGTTQETIIPLAASSPEAAEQNRSKTGFYAISFGAGKQGVGLTSLSFIDNRFTAGTKLSGKLGFTNTGTTAIRASASEPATVVLQAKYGNEVQDIAVWNLTESVRSGESVELDFTMNTPLTADLPGGAVFTATISENEKYIGSENAFVVTTDPLLTVAEKPELGIESLTVEPISAKGDVTAEVEFVVSNRGSKSSENVYVQFSYESGSDENGAPIYSPLDISKNTLTVGAQTPIPNLTRSVTGDDFANGIIHLGLLDPAYQRRVSGTIDIPKSAFADDSLKLHVEVFSETSDVSNIRGFYKSTHSDEYSSINNVRTLSVNHKTFFSAPEKITIALGNTLRLPVSFTATSETSDITVREITDGTENWTPKLGILYYDSAAKCVVAAPNETGSGIIQIQDSKTNTIFAIAFKATELGSGINIFRDDESFEFAGDWNFVEDSKGWAGEENDKLVPPMNNDLVKANADGASVSFRTLADTIKLRFVGKVTITSDLPGFTAITADSSELRANGKYPLVVDFNNPDGKTHNVTITVTRGTELDRYEATYGEYVDPTPPTSGEPEIRWSRSFPETASIEVKKGETPESVELIAYVSDDNGILDVGLRADSGNAIIGTIAKVSEKLWLVPVTVSGNGSFTLSVKNLSGVESKSNVNAYWYNETITTGAKSTAPDFGADDVSFVKSDGTKITETLPRSEKAFIEVYYKLKPGEKLTVNGTAMNGNRYEVKANGFYTVRVTAEDGTWSQVVMYMDKLENGDIMASPSVDTKKKLITVTVDAKRPDDISVTASGPDGKVTFTKTSDGIYTYSYKKSGDYTIHVTDGTTTEILKVTIPKTVETLGVLTAPKTRYSMGDPFDITGLTLRATYSDGSEATLDDTSKMSVKGFDSSKKQTLNLSVSYEAIDATATLEVTILFAGKVTLLDVNDDAYGDGVYTEGEIVNVFPGTRDGYAFVGWSTENLTLTDKTATSFTMPDNSKLAEPEIILVANWKKLSTVTIINGAKNATGAGIYKEGDEVTIWAGKDSRTFLLWRSNDIEIPEGTGDRFTFTMPKHDVTLTAVWLGLLPSLRTVRFETNGGSSIRDLSAHDGQKIDLSVYVPTKEGYEFTGWFTDSSLTNRIETLTVKGDIVLFAGWKQIKTEPVEPITLPFDDVKPGDWFYDDVYYVYVKGMMNGTSATTFSPELETSRAMIVTILHRLEGRPEPEGESTFTDVESGSWYEKAVTWAAENGIVNGYGEGIFGPSDSITREQLAAILYRYSNFKGIDTTVEAEEVLKNFTDAHEISSYALDPMKWAVDRGLINGMTTTTLAPTSTALRSQAAAIFHRFCEN